MVNVVKCLVCGVDFDDDKAMSCGPDKLCNSCLVDAVQNEMKNLE